MLLKSHKSTFSAIRKKIIFSLTSATLLLLSSTCFSQTVNLGSLTSFEAYTGSGNITNSGGTLIGDVGSNLGFAYGFDPASYPAYEGTINSMNTATQQAQSDLLNLYTHLNNLPTDFPNPLDLLAAPPHAATFGTGEILDPGVYYIPSAASIGGNLTLDGGGNPEAIFVLRIIGALTASATTNIILTGGAQSCNVFFLANGAITAAAGAILKGTLFSKEGAVGLAANVQLEGRMFTLVGAITIGLGANAIQPLCAYTTVDLEEDNSLVSDSIESLGIELSMALATIAGLQEDLFTASNSLEILNIDLNSAQNNLVTANETITTLASDLYLASDSIVDLDVDLVTANEIITELESNLEAALANQDDSISQEDIDFAYLEGFNSVICEELITEDITFSLPEGWSMFGFTCLESEDAINAFLEITDKIDIVKDDMGLSYLPEWGFNALGVLQYSEGYQIKMLEQVDEFQFCPTYTPSLEP